MTRLLENIFYDTLYICVISEILLLQEKENIRLFYISYIGFSYWLINLLVYEESKILIKQINWTKFYIESNTFTEKFLLAKLLNINGLCNFFFNQTTKMDINLFVSKENSMIKEQINWISKKYTRYILLY